MTSTIGLMLSILLGIGAVFFALWPLAGREPAARTPQSSATARLLEERDRALAAMRELDLDRRSGRISEAEYRELARLRRGEAAAALQKLDAFER